jgi:tetratricopeptide (TPR) repeat protein
MNYSRYTDLLEAVAEQANQLMCLYCGEETLTTGDIAVCSNCESLVYDTSSALRSKDATLFENLLEIKKGIVANDYDKVLALYDKLIAANKDPAYLYAKALVYIKYSNSQISSIRYDREGFMDENVPLRDTAAKYTSLARATLNESLNVSAVDIAGTKPPLTSVYTTFLCQIKLTDFRGASNTLQIIKNMQNVYVAEYSAMVLESNLRHDDEALKHAEFLLEKGAFSVNAFFYIALALFDKKNYSEARKIADLLKKVMKNNSIDVLLYNIEQEVSI